MTTTINAFLALQFSNVLAANLVAKGYSVVSLAEVEVADLKLLGLTDENIAQFRKERPNIATETIDKVLKESWRACCVCRITGKPFVVHHIKEWADNGTHSDANLVVLCLEHHHEVHLKGGLASTIEKHDLPKLKKEWIAKATQIRDKFARSITSDRASTRWYWIHVDNLMMATNANARLLDARDLTDETKTMLTEAKCITSDGHIAPKDGWLMTKEKPAYAFDSQNGAFMAWYISVFFCRYLANTAMLDITDMLARPEMLKHYLRGGELVFFRAPVEITAEADPAAYDKPGKLATGTVNMTEVKITFAFDPWTSLNATGRRIHVLQDADRSIVGKIQSVQQVGRKVHITLSPLGISPDFLLHDPAQGGFAEGADNSEFEERRKLAKDAV